MKQPVLIVVILALFVTSCAQSKSAAAFGREARSPVRQPNLCGRKYTLGGYVACP